MVIRLRLKVPHVSVIECENEILHSVKSFIDINVSYGSEQPH